MTDALIKALEKEIHIANDIGDVHSMMIRIGLIKDALDLINRLQADKEALINGQETLQKHIADQKAEIERLERDIEWNNAKHREKLSDRRYACGVLWDSLEKETEENRKLKAELDKLAEDYSNLQIEKDELFAEAERYLRSNKLLKADIEELKEKLADRTSRIVELEFEKENNGGR